MLVALFTFALIGGLAGTLGGTLLLGFDGFVLGGSTGLVLGVFLWLALWIAYNRVLPAGLDRE